MEERNILWGELVGGLLVVGCSLALVVSLWHTFSDNPLFKFFTFTGAVAAVFGAGLYTLHRWKLESTSRGLLLVASLLTPVCQLAMILPGTGGRLEALLAILSLLLLSALLYRAGRVLTPDAPGLLAAAMLLTVGCQLPATRLMNLKKLSDAQLLLFALLPVLGHGLACGAMLWRESRRKEMDGHQGLSVLLFLGVAAFPLLVTLGLFVWLIAQGWHSFGDTLGLLGPVLALVGLPALTGGALVHRGLTNVPNAGSNRAAGTIVALAGMVVMLLAAALSWPRPVPVIAVCLLDFAALTVIAFCFNLPVVHALAIPCLSAAFVTTCALLSGQAHGSGQDLAERMLTVVTSPGTGAALLLLFAACGIVSEWMARAGAVAHGKYYAAGAIGLMLLSLALVAPAGLVEPVRAALVFGLGGLGTLLLNRRWRRAELTYLGLVLLIAASLWGLWRVDKDVTPLWGAVLALESLTLTAPLALRRLREPKPSSNEVLDLESAQLDRAALRRDPWLVVGTVVAWAAVGIALRCLAIAFDQGAARVWHPAYIVTALGLAAMWTLRALAERARLYARFGAWHALAAVIAVASWAAEMAHLDPQLFTSVAVSLAGAAFTAAAVYFRAGKTGAEGVSRREWGLVLAPAWAEAGGGAAILAILIGLPVGDNPVQVFSLAGIAATAFLLAWCYRQPIFAVIGSGGVLVMLAHLFLCGVDVDRVAHPFLAALHAHATLALIASLLLERRIRQDTTVEGDDWRRLLRTLFVRPLTSTATWSTFLAVPCIVAGLKGSLSMLSVWTLWLALLWLVGAWVRRKSGLFAAFQTALTLAVLLAVSGVYQRYGYDLEGVRVLQMHALALGLLSLLWVLARQSPRLFDLFADLLPRRWPAVDRAVLAGLFGVHLALAALAIAPGFTAEISNRPAPSVETGGKAVLAEGAKLPPSIDPLEDKLDANLAAKRADAQPKVEGNNDFDAEALARLRRATGVPAWALTALLAVVLLITARQSVGQGVVLGLLALAITTAILASAPFADGRALSFGLRWSLALCFLLGSVPVWYRETLAPRLERLGFRAAPGSDLAATARRVLVACTVGPVLLLALTPTLLRFLGGSLAAPLDGSLFARMPRLHANVWPLVFICVGLIVHALRERLPVYAFVVGLGGNVLASIILRASLKFMAPVQYWWLPLLQANVIAFGVGALLWLFARRRLYGERGTGLLLDVQVRLALYGNLVLLLGAFIPLVLDPTGTARTLVQAGHWRGWLALALAGTATWWYLTATQQVRLYLGAALGLAASMLLAASATWIAKTGPSWWPAQPWLAFHVLTAAWTVCGGVFLAFLWAKKLRSPSPLYSGERGWGEGETAGEVQPPHPRPLSPEYRGEGGVSRDSLRTQGEWTLAGIVGALLALALRGALATDPLAPWWCAGVVLGAGVLAAGMAVWQRRGEWAFAASACLNLAVSLIVWHAIRGEAWQQAWVWLLQANILASSGAACLWLFIRRRLVLANAPTTLSPWFGVQLLLGFAGNLILVLHAAYWLIESPQAQPVSVALVGGSAGWIATLAALLPIVLFAGRSLIQGGIVLLTGLLLSLAVMAAASAARLNHDWLAYHVLLIGCALAALPALVSGIRAWSHRESSPPLFDLALLCVVAVCGLTLGLALNGLRVDPHQTWWVVGVSLYAGGIGAALACMRRREVWAFAGGLCVQLATTLAVLHLQIDILALGLGRVLQANTVAGAVVALFWMTGYRRLYGEMRPAPLLRAQVVALLALNTALLIGPLVLLVVDPWSPSVLVSAAGELPGWLSLGLALVVVGWYTGRALAAETVHVLNGLGLALGVLTACTFARAEGHNWLSYHILLASWAALGGVILAFAIRRGAGFQPAESGQAESLPHEGANWVAGLALLVLGLALRGAAGSDPDKPWWPAGGVLASGLLVFGLALWLKREVWAFAAVIAVNVALSLVLWDREKDDVLSNWWPVLLRGNLLAGMIAVLAWLAGARRLYGRLRPALRSAPWLTLYVAVGLAGAALLVVEPAVLLVCWPETILPHVEKAGEPINWVALAAVGAVAWWHFRIRLDRGSGVGKAAGGVVLAVLAGCFATQWDHDGSWLAYHVLTVGCVLAGGLVLGSGLWLARRASDAPTTYPWRQDLCIIVPGVLALALAIRGVFGDPLSSYWSAGIVLLVGVQAGVMAGWRRSETWAGAATLLCDLAVSLFLLDAGLIANLGTQWIFLLQANVLTLAISSLVWQAAGRRIYGARPPGLAQFPLLTIQIILGLAGNVALLFNPDLFALIRDPGHLPSTVSLADGMMGWATLGANALAVCLHLRLTRMRGGANVLGGLGVGVVILSAFTAARWDTPESWLAYHALMTGLVVLGGAMVAGGWLSAQRRRRALRGDVPPGEPFVSEAVAEGWLSGVAIPVFMLALRAVFEDRTGAEWSAGCILGVSLLGALLSLWQRRERWAFLSGLGVNVAVTLLLMRPHEHDPLATWWLTLLRANVVVLGAVALIWMTAKVRLVRGRSIESRLLGCQLLLGVAGVVVSLGLPAVRLVWSPRLIDPMVIEAGSPLNWAALASVAAAVACYSGVRRGRRVVQVLSPLLLAVGILAACSVAQTTQEDWLAYHVLLSAWSLTGLVLVPIAWAVSRRSSERVPLDAVKAWGVLIGGLILALGIRGALEDPSGAKWSAAAIIAASAMAGMAAVWRRSELGAFAAALGFNLALSLVVWRANSPDLFANWWVEFVQANVVATSAAALAWLAAARWLYDEPARQQGSAPLRAVQVLLGLLGNAILLLGPLVWLLVRPDDLEPTVARAGGAWGWATFAVALIPAVWHWWGRVNRAMAHLLCVAGLALGVLAACTSAGFVDPDWRSYHILSAVWFTVGLVALGAARTVARLSEGDIAAELREQRLDRSRVYQGWVAVIAALLLGLALRGVEDDPLKPVWPVGAVLGVGVLAAGLAVLRRREGWAFLAALCVNLAASLAIAHEYRETPFADWWVVLVQANIAASALSALGWLMGWRFLYRAETVPGTATPFLTCQTLLGVLGNAALLIGPTLRLIGRPEELHDSIRQAGSVWGWLVFGLALLPAAWHFGRGLAAEAVHLLCSLGLGIGVLAACTTADQTQSSWIAYRVLTAGWALTGLATLAIGWWKAPSAGDGVVQTWAAGLGLIVFGLVLKGVATAPAELLWAAGFVLAPGAIAGGLALWLRREIWAFGACICINCSVSFATWHLHVAEPFTTWAILLIQLNLIASAATALAWTVVGRRLNCGVALAPASAPLLTRQIGLALLGNAVLLVLAGCQIIANPAVPLSFVASVGHVWGWVALCLTLFVGERHFRGWWPRAPVFVAAGSLLLLPLLGACTVAQFDHAWLSFRVLLIGWALAGPVLVGIARLGRQSADSNDAAAPLAFLQAAVAWFGALTILLAVRSAPLEAVALFWSATAIATLVVGAAALALWLRREEWAFAAGLCVNLSVSLFVWHAHLEQPLDSWWVRLIQANVVGSSVVALAWLAVVRRLYGEEPRGLRAAPLLTFQIALGLIGNAVLLGAPAFWLVTQPNALPPEVGQAGEWRGWLALLLALAASAWHAGRVLARGGVVVFCGLGLALGVLAACSTARVHPGDWRPYHVLMVSWAAIGSGVLALGWGTHRRQTETPTAAASWQTAATFVGMLAAALALRGIAGEDPTGPWWSAAVLLGVSCLAGALAFWSHDQEYVYVSGVLFVVAAIIASTGWGQQRPVDWFVVGILALAAASGVWSALARSAGKGGDPSLLALRAGGLIPFAHVAIVLASACLFAAGLGTAVLGLGTHPLLWPSFTVTCLALVVALWDDTTRFPLAGLYLAGLSGIGIWTGEAPAHLHWLAIPLLGGYVTFASLCRRAGPFVLGLKEDLGLSLSRRWPTFWFVPAQLGLATLVVLGTLLLCLYGDRLDQRLLGGPFAVALLLPAVVMLAHSADLSYRSFARYTALGLVALAPAELVWASLDPTAPMLWLQRGGLLCAVLSVLTIVYGIVLPRLASEDSGWPATGRRAGVVVGITALGLFALVLEVEATMFAAGAHAVLPRPVALTILAAVGLLIAAGIWLAVSPGTAVPGLSQRRRAVFVYAAELLLLAAFAHLRLSVPELFDGRLAHYWPFIVLGLAFLSTAVSEVFEGLGVRVLAEPLRRTGIFLPIIPVLGFWIGLTGDASSYSSLWFSVGLFYGLIAIYNRSMAFALLAALSVNAGLWAVLHEQQMAFVRHPQLWLVPFASIVLIGSHLNRDRLGRKQMATLRYLALTVIYLASTAETFLTGLGADVTRPLLLVGLSLVGVFAGMMLRVRAFLFLGSGFAGLGMFALVRHAAMAKAWVWYVAGIIVGIIIIVLFAVFEKRREEILKVLERLREWE